MFAHIIARMGREATRSTIRHSQRALVADACRFDLSSDLGYKLPDADVPQGYTPGSYLQQLCYEAAVRRYGSVTRKVAEPLREEFRLIERHNLAGFLLLYHEIVLLAQEIIGRAEAGPPGNAPGGTAAGWGARLLRRPAGGLPHRHQPR